MIKKTYIRTEKTNGDVILSNILDSVTGKSVEYKKVTSYIDGSLMTDTKVDGIIYRKLVSSEFGIEYFMKILTGKIYLNDWGVQDGDDISIALQKAIDISTYLGYEIIIEAGTYYVSNITLRNNTEIKANKDVKFLATGVNVDGFRGVGIKNIKISGIEINASGQSSTFRNFYFENSENITIENCEISGGENGIRAVNCTNLKFNNNHIYNMVFWGIYADGGSNIFYSYNVAHNNGYDGLKIAGSVDSSAGNIKTIKNVIVNNNIAYNNGRDGFDLATNILENVNVHDNIFRDNVLQGIDFKILTEYVGGAKDCTIKNNICTGNLNIGINMLCQNPDSYYRNIQVTDNYISGVNSLNTGVYAITANINNTVGNKCIIARNTIKNIYDGIRLNNTSNSEIYDNNIEVERYGIWLWNGGSTDICSNNTIRNNEVKARTGSGISIGTDTLAIIGICLNNTIHSNRSVTQTSSKKGIYDDPLALSVRYNNTVGKYDGVNPTPQIAANKGDLVETSLVVDKGHTHWICYENNAIGETKFYALGGLDPDLLTRKVGTTAQRPIPKRVPFMYFDANLSKPIWWNGSNWKDATGITV